MGRTAHLGIEEMHGPEEAVSRIEHRLEQGQVGADALQPLEAQQRAQFPPAVRAARQMLLECASAGDESQPAPGRGRFVAQPRRVMQRPVARVEPGGRGPALAHEERRERVEHVDRGVEVGQRGNPRDGIEDLQRNTALEKPRQVGVSPAMPARQIPAPQKTVAMEVGHDYTVMQFPCFRLHAGRTRCTGAVHQSRDPRGPPREAEDQRQGYPGRQPEGGAAENVRQCLDHVPSAFSSRVW